MNGFKDVIGLDTIVGPAVAIMSNKITEHQVTKAEWFAKRQAGGKEMLLFDVDEAGNEVAKEAVWLLTQRGFDVRLGWSRGMLRSKSDRRHRKLS